MSIHDSLIGKTLGDYRILDLLGQGGMARVYRGYDENLERYAAVKVFDSFAVTSEELEEYRERFQREARAIARLHHPQIVGIYQFGQIETINYMAMAFIEGRDLRYILKEHNEASTRISTNQIIRILTDVASALDYAHSEGVIHRDIKPSNIMIMADGHAVLTDFGLALNTREGTIGTTFGSVHYIAPEQAVSSAQAVPQSDLYSLGVVLYEMLTGKVPFDDASAMSVALRHLSDPPPSPRAYNPRISPDVEAMVVRALDKDPQKRYQTGSEFIRALEMAMGVTDQDEKTRNVPLKSDPVAGVPALATSTDSGPPAPVVSDGSAPTVSDSKNRPALAEAPPPPARSRRLWNIGIVVGVLLLLGGGALILSGLMGPTVGEVSTSVVGILEPSASPTASPTPITPTAPPATATVSPVAGGVAVTGLSESSTGEATEAAIAETEEATEAAIPETEEVTAAATTEPSATPTDEPSATPTDEPTATPTVGPKGDVRLVYNDRSLVLLNQSDEPVDVSNLIFSQRTAEGNELLFRSNSWGGGSQPPSNLPADDCFQVWSIADTFVEQPDYCGVRHSWRQVAPTRLFWQSEIDSATFTVRRGDDTLAECAVSAGACEFTVP